MATSPFDKYLGTDQGTEGQPASDPFARYLGEDVTRPEADPFAKYLEPVSAPEPRGEEGGLLASAPIQESEVIAIARKYGQDPEEFLEIAQWSGVPVYTREGAALPQMGRVFAGEVGERFLLGLPQFLGKKLLDDENARKALDEVRELRRTRQSTLGATTEALSGLAVPAQLVPQATSLAGKVGVSAATGALGGLAASREDEEIASTLVGGALGAAITGGAAAVPATTRTVARILRPVVRGTPIEGKSLTQAATKYLEESPWSTAVRDEAGELVTSLRSLDVDAVKKYLDEAIPDTNSTLTEMARILSGRSPGSNEVVARTLVEKANTEGLEFLNKTLTDVTTSRAMQDYALEMGLKYRPTEWEPLRAAADFFSDTRYVMKDLDRRYDLDLLPTLDKMSESYHQYLTKVSEFGSRINALIKETGERGVSVDKVRDMLDGKVAAVSRSEQELLAGWRGLTDNMLKAAQDAGLTIARRENYLPHAMASNSEILRRLNREMTSSTGKELGTTLDAKDFSSISDDLKKSLQFLTDSTEPPQNVAQLNELVQQVLTSGRVGQLGTTATQARAALTREGMIPELLRETDLGKLMSGWTHSTFRHAYMREGIAEINAKLPVLKSLGDEQGARYIRNWLSDISGGSRGLSRFGSGVAERYSYRMYKLADKQAEQGNQKLANVLEAAGNLPRLMHSTYQLIYPNALGLNFRATVRNLGQPFLMTAPELQGAWGYGKAVAAAGKTAVRMRSGIGALEADLRTRNLIPPKYQGENLHILTNEVMRSAPVSMTRKAASYIADRMMYFYEKSDVLCRHVTLEASKDVARELMEGTASANRYLASLSVSYRRQLSEAISAGNARQVETLIARNLLAETQFNYNRTSLAEYGRYMGPIFSVFSKWPTAIAGDIIEKYRGGQMGRAAAKYLGPMAVLYMLDFFVAPSTLPGALGEAAQSTSRNDWTESDRMKHFLVGSGFRSWSPLTAAGSVVTGDIFQAPGVSIASGLAKGLISADTEQLNKVVNEVARSYAPGAGIVRVISDDMATLLSGSRPEGPFLNRAVEGTRITTEEISRRIRNIGVAD